MLNLSNHAGDNCTSSESSPTKLSNPGDLYFVKVGPYLKIGRTRDLKERLRILACHAPVAPKLIGAIAGAGPTEKAWHYAFRNINSHREWFKIAPALKRSVDAALRGESWIALCSDDPLWCEEVRLFAAERGMSL